MDGGSSAAVMADAQYTLVRVCRPFADFERVYQGRPATVPIAFPGVLDPRAAAGQAGFSPALLKGYPVPFGSRLVIEIPVCFNEDTPSLYSYRLIWRFAGSKTAQEARPMHLRSQSRGAPDSTGTSPALRYPTPASWHMIAYEETEPVSGSGRLVIRVERIIPVVDSLVAPRLPNGAMATIEQGIFDPADFAPGSATPVSPTYVPFWTDAMGDELLLLANPEPADSEGRVWDFTDPALDKPFSDLYGSSNGARPPRLDVGITLQTGTSP